MVLRLEMFLLNFGGSVFVVGCGILTHDVMVDTFLLPAMMVSYCQMILSKLNEFKPQ